ncbi:(2Fe-2S) ferredoxin domain-containing protein [Thermanaerosceptrum fracticalcis]|jgi:NADP-reducing hydrogenase subunit HndB|uniref:(2Fe-2S) ferredoxin domain-containing protein n=1 Tax=Thermanaerosceptrum fracticalcis TaxID=1712410 RepID=A0A7G6E7M9_THEFR|nr:(2Fe-2S) ferredoxin domain-containing protein [Thermanaerosceptrum fracticalcis]QNB48083.1 (2Fe-2S) ferredoxin domain-containing protein [Thermanaerosceptrum fracticalcis]
MKSLEELKKIKEETRERMALREAKEGQVRVTVGMGTCGIAAGAREILNILLEEINKRNLPWVAVLTTGCPGICKKEPIVQITESEGTTYTYGEMTPERVKIVVARHLVNKQPVWDWLIGTRNPCGHRGGEQEA